MIMYNYSLMNGKLNKSVIPNLPTLDQKNTQQVINHIQKYHILLLFFAELIKSF